MDMCDSVPTVELHASLFDFMTQPSEEVISKVSLMYVVVELFQKRLYDEKVDVFAFGSLLWELVAREVPYDGLDVGDIRAKVERDEPLKIPYGTDPRLGQLIHECR